MSQIKICRISIINRFYVYNSWTIVSTNLICFFLVRIPMCQLHTVMVYRYMLYQISHDIIWHYHFINLIKNTPLRGKNILLFIFFDVYFQIKTIKTMVWGELNGEKGTPSGSIACMGKQQPRFYWSCSSLVMNNATPLTPPSAWAELYFQM